MTQNKDIPLTEFAYRRIRDAITESRIQPGTFTSEPRLSAELDISRSALREALIRLEMEHYVERSPTPSGRNGRWRVKPLTKRDVIELYTCRGALEGLAASLAAEHASPSQLDEMEETLKLLRAAVEDEDAETMVSATTKFHDLVIEAGGNQRLVALMSTLRLRILENRRLMIEHKTRSSVFVEQNEELFRAIVAGDVETCEEIARKSSEDDIRSIIDLFDRGILAEEHGRILE